MGEDLRVRPGVVIPGTEIAESVSRAGGPGGQHVNKTSTRVSLRWAPAASAALGPLQRERVLAALAGRLTGGGELVVSNGTTRSRARNRERARARLAELVREALAVRRPRRATRPSRTAREQRLASKRRRSGVKRGRGRVQPED